MTAGNEAQGSGYLWASKPPSGLLDTDGVQISIDRLGQGLEQRQFRGRVDPTNCRPLANHTHNTKVTLLIEANDYYWYQKMTLLKQLSSLRKEERPKFVRAFIMDHYERAMTLLKELGLAHENEKLFIIQELQTIKEEAASALPIVERLDVLGKLKMITRIDLSRWVAITNNAKQSEKKATKSQRLNTHHRGWHNDGNASDV